MDGEAVEVDGDMASAGVDGGQGAVFGDGCYRCIGRRPVGCCRDRIFAAVGVGADKVELALFAADQVQSVVVGTQRLEDGAGRAGRKGRAAGPGGV